MKNFKRILIALMVALAAVGSAQAKTIAFGIKAGMNVNKLSFDKDIAKADNSVGWTAGVMADITIPLLGFGVDASVMYSRMNNNSDADLLATGVSYGNNELYGKNFLEIPINLKYKFTLPVVGSAFKPYLFTGPSFAFRLDKGVEDAIYNLKSRTFQMAWNVGVGFEFFSHLQIGASYGFGCNNIVDKITSVTGTNGNFNLVDTKAKNNYWTVTAAYLF